MSMHHMHQSGSKAASNYYKHTTYKFKPFSHHTCNGRRQLTVVAGEARSANRTKWTRQDAEQQLARQMDTNDVRISNGPVQQLADIDPHELVWGCAADLQPLFAAIDKRVAANLKRVQAAFKRARIGPHHFLGSTGYGHGDLGREALDQVMADVMGAEAALVRIQFMSGTHAIAAGLFAALRPGDEMLAVAGNPYDTMEEVIGLRGTPGHGSLMEWGITYRELPLAAGGKLDWDALATAIKPGLTKVAHIQRSCGYALRPTLTVEEIGRAVQIIKAQDPNVLVLVDNCYGEFTEEQEPTAVGADLVMGSLIKNAGGTLAPGGGYVAGRAGLVAAVGARLAAPGVGTDAGGVPGTTMRTLFQGLFLASQTTGEAVKGGRLVAEVMTRLGFRAVPSPAPGLPDPPSMITAVEMGSREGMVAFCKGIQLACPVGSYIRPEPGVTAGYGDEVIFADGTFIDGSTAELSADGPIRPPYVVYCQGGTHWTHWALALESALASLAESGVAPPPPAAAAAADVRSSSGSGSNLQDEEAVLVC
ncbi:methionine gamma-lyase-domain-containing protein [Scenedesmus sp. NREL 46B-D3]|nr:methionine gamma-lyase-domain-containing protein [Scenedesmus sp. NREL 46B-D3]